MQESKPYAEACERNRSPILEVLRRHVADRRRVLEIGSGTGQHAVHFAAALPYLEWQTSDLEASLPGIRLWLAEAARPNLPPPLALDVRHGPWPREPFDVVFTANTLHIMGWEEVRAFFAALPRLLAHDGLLVVYGPFNYEGRFTSASNAAFDGWLRQRSSASGIRDFEAVDALARSIGLALVEDCAMPANNRTLIWQRALSAPTSG
jgi:cyclopropane fatty-acyl-phospholipid synthase-like methyltransferase